MSFQCVTPARPGATKFSGAVEQVTGYQTATVAASKEGQPCFSSMILRHLILFIKCGKKFLICGSRSAVPQIGTRLEPLNSSNSYMGLLNLDDFLLQQHSAFWISSHLDPKSSVPPRRLHGTYRLNFSYQ